MNKGISILITITLILSSHNYLCSQPKKPEKVTLTSRFLQIIDGAFLTGEVVGITLQVRKKLIEMGLGKRLSDGSHQGTYIIEDSNHCIQELADIEKKILEAQELLNKKLQSNISETEKDKIVQELQNIEEEITRLNSVLNIAKKDFQDAVCVFISQARTVKEPVIMLIDEFCEKANRPDSLLLDWARLNNDDEEESFNQQVKNFRVFYTFINDLANFLEAMVRGCPKAQLQFKKLMIEKSKRV